MPQAHYQTDQRKLYQQDPNILKWGFASSLEPCVYLNLKSLHTDPWSLCSNNVCCRVAKGKKGAGTLQLTPHREMGEVLQRLWSECGKTDKFIFVLSPLTAVQCQESHAHWLQ